jgi:D-hexose-6-phosphate mutarotase
MWIPYFAYYENEKRWIPIPELSFNKEFKISCENGNTFDYELDSDVELWLCQLVFYGAYNLSLYTIAPPLPSFNIKSITKIPVSGMPEVNILEVKEKVIELPKKSIKDISEKINL